MVSIPNIGLFDLGLGLLYLFIIYFFAFRYKQKKKNKNPEYNYYLLGLTTKVIGSLAFVIISVYYYKEGDTFLYFQIAEDLRSNLFVNYRETIETLFTPYSELSQASFNPLEKYNYYFERESNWEFGRIVFCFNLISFGSYLVCSILMATVSFLGLWLGYRAMCKLYVKSSKLFLMPFFLIPTALMWSSCILKDTLIVAVTGVLLYSFSKVFIFRNKFLINILMIVGGMLALQFLRPILLIILFPCLMYWGLLYLTKPIQKLFVRGIARFAIVVVMLVVGYFINLKVLDSTSKYRVENLLQTVEGIQSFHSMEVFAEGQNSYTFGGYIATPQAIIKKIPEAINVTLFRPYIWEVNNWPMLMGAIESLLLFILLVYVLVVSKMRFFRVMIKNYEVIIMFLFSIIYSVIVGISSYNFGALSRYKIPAIMLFFIALVIIYNKENISRKTKNE